MKSNKSVYSNIKSYEELEASIRMLRRMEDSNRFSSGVSQLLSGSRPRLSWTDLALVAIRSLRKRLLK